MMMCILIWRRDIYPLNSTWYTAIDNVFLLRQHHAVAEGPLWLNMACAIPVQPKNHTVSLLFALFSTVEYHAGHTLDLLRPPPLIISFAENLTLHTMEVQSRLTIKISKGVPYMLVQEKIS
jgi:hypothetical protein